MSPGRMKITDKSLGKVKTIVSCKLGEDVLGAALSGDGSRLVLGSYSKLVYFVGKKERFHKDISKFSGVSLSSSGERILVTTYDTCMLLGENGEELWKFEGSEGVDLAVLSADGDTIVVACGRELLVFDGSGRKLWNNVLPERIWSLAVSEEGEHVTAGTSKAIHSFQGGKPSWDFRTGKLVLKIRLTPGGKHCAFTSNRHVFFFNSNGLMEWSLPTEYCRELGMAADGDVVAAGLSMDMIVVDDKGDKVFDYRTRDFILSLEMASSGECIVVGNGSDVFRSSEVICLDGRGRELWRYRAHERVNDIAVSETGRFVAFCDNRRGVLVDNRMLVARSAERVIESGKRMMLELIDEELDVAREKKMLIEAEKFLASGKNEESLKMAKKMYASCRNIKERYAEARERVPGWMEKLGYQPAAGTGIGAELVRTVFPIYVMHKVLEENTSIRNFTGRYQKRYNSYVESRKAIDLEKLKSVRGEGSASVKEMEYRITRSSIASLSLNRLIGRLGELNSQRIQYIFGLEDRTRDIILDRIDGKECRGKVRKVEEEAKIYFERLEDTVNAISQQAQTIDGWLMADRKDAAELGIEVTYDYQIKDKNFKFIVSVKNNTSRKLYKTSLHIFTILDEAEIIAPASGVEMSPEILEPGKRAEFSFLIRMNSVQNQGVNGYLEFSDKDQNVTRLKLDTFSPDIVVPFLEPLIRSEKQYTTTRSRGKGKTMNKGLDIEAGSVREACERVIETGGEMYVVRGIPANVDSLSSAIIWLSGQLNNEKLLAGFTFTTDEKAPGMVHIDMSVYCRNEKYSSGFLGEFEKKLMG